MGVAGECQRALAARRAMGKNRGGQRCGSWPGNRLVDTVAPMFPAFIKALAALGLAVLAFAADPALAQRQIGTLERGAYVCELPGDATARAGIEQEQENFTIASASRYSSQAGSGTYLRRGDVVEMTSGPRTGERYQVVSERFLRKMDDGRPGRLRCVRQGG